MPTKSYCFSDLTLIENVSKVIKVDDAVYVNVIPEEMRNDLLNEISYEIFGCQSIEILLSRFIFHKPLKILITDFASNGFFWAQVDEENEVIDEYKILYEKINEPQLLDSLPRAKLESKKCIANFDGEWFRASVIGKNNDSQLKLFFFDYGTIADVNLSETRLIEDDDIWVVPPLAIPFVLKDFLKASKPNSFKEMQYSSFTVKEMKLIRNNSIFEVELIDENGLNLLETL